MLDIITLYFSCILITFSVYASDLDQKAESASSKTKPVSQVCDQCRFIAADEQNAQALQISKAAALLSVTFKNIIEDLGVPDAPIPVHNISHTTLQRVVECLNLIHDDRMDDLNSKINDLDPSALFQMLQAANYLDIRKLRSLCTEHWGKLCDDNFDDFKKNQTYVKNHIFTRSKTLPLELNQLCARYILSAADTPSFFTTMLSTSAKTLTGHTDKVNSICFNPDGKTLASASADKNIKLWSVADGNCIQTLSGHTKAVKSACFNPDGKTLASASFDGTIKLWSVADSYLISTLSGHTTIVYSVCFSPDGKTLASASFNGTIKLWSVTNGNCIQALSDGEGPVFSVYFSPDGETLASASLNGIIKLWSVADGSYSQSLSMETGQPSICFSPDNKILASRSSDHTTIRLWNVADGSLIKTLSGHSGALASLCFSPDGKTLASGSEDYTIKLLNVTDGSPILTLSGHTGKVNSVSFSPDSKKLASGSWDNTIKLWDLSALQFIQHSFNELTIEQLLFLRLVKEAAEDKKSVDLSDPEHVHLAEIYKGLPEKIENLVRKCL